MQDCDGLSIRFAGEVTLLQPSDRERTPHFGAAAPLPDPCSSAMRTIAANSISRKRLALHASRTLSTVSAQFLPLARTTMLFDSLLLNGALRQSLVAVRSLGRRGLNVAAAGTHRNAPALSSRWCRQGFVFPREEALGAYLATLDTWLERAGAQVLIASNDATIALLRMHRARFEPQIRLALANERALAIAVNKERTLEVARCLGLHVPREVVVREVGDVPLALSEIGLPAVVKPCESWLWNGREGTRLGAQLVVTPAEACHAVAAVTRFGEVALFQQLLTGRREAVSFLYADGEVYARFAQWAKRTSPPLGGNSVLRESIAVPSDTGR